MSTSVAFYNIENGTHEPSITVHASTTYTGIWHNGETYFFFDGTKTGAGYAKTNSIDQVESEIYHKRSTSTSLSALDVVYDGTPTQASSAEIDPTGFSMGTLSLYIISVSTPNFLRIYLQTKDSAGNWMNRATGIFSRLTFEDQGTASGINRSFEYPLPSTPYRITITTSGTTALKTFEVQRAEVAHLS